ncbi:lycopene beta cyclase [Fagus crenata]
MRSLDALFSMISPIILVTKWLMVSRTLAGAPIVANAIIRYLGSDDGLSGNDLSAEVWKHLWPIQRRRQREFFFFGMDILLTSLIYQTQLFALGCQHSVVLILELSLRYTERNHVDEVDSDQK